MKIVITNESSLKEHHLNQLKNFGEVKIYTDTNSDNCAERLKDADIAVIDCFLTPVTREFLSKLPNLKFFTINSTGYDNVDTEVVHELKIIASNIPGFSTVAVAELAIGLMFATAKKIVEGDREFRNGLHEIAPGTPEAKKYLGFNLEGKTLGVVGLGKIGTRIAEVGKNIGMKIIAYNRTQKEIPEVSIVSLEKLMSQSDVVIISLALNNETKGIINKNLISQMKKTSILVNIAGMPIIDQNALIEALNSEAIAGAGIDTGDESMLNVKNTVLTPHMAWNTQESYENMASIIVENVKAYIKGSPINTI
jgi:glycerate dehydrogenase